MSPAAFERECTEDAIACEDVLEAFILASSDAFSGANVLRVLFRERARDAKAKRDEIKGLVGRLRVERDPAARAVIERRIGELNKWP